MRKTVASLLIFAAALAAIGFFWAGTMSKSALAAAPTTDMVLIQCRTWHVFGDPGPPRWVVNISSSSEHAPEVPTGEDTNCPQEIVNLLEAGFEMEVVSGSDQADFLAYQFLRTVGRGRP